MKPTFTATATAVECGGCNLAKRWVLHNVRHRGIYRRLCTSCVLKLHPGSFCPFCFEFYDSPLPPHLRVVCQKCPSISHQHCLPPHSDSFVCPPCLSNAFTFFNPIAKSQSDHRSLDHNLAKILFCAARIASVSMKKAVGAARGEAERRVKEAAFAKKRAREALQHVAAVTAKIARSFIVDVKDEEVGKGNGIVGNMVVTMAERNRYPNKDREDGLNNSCEASANLAQSIANGGALNIEDKERGRMGAGSGIGRPSLQNNATVNEKEKPGDIPHLGNFNGLEEKANKAVPFVGGHFQHMQGRNNREEGFTSQ